MHWLTLSPESLDLVVLWLTFNNFLGDTLSFLKVKFKLFDFLFSLFIDAMSFLIFFFDETSLFLSFIMEIVNLNWELVIEFDFKES